MLEHTTGFRSMSPWLKTTTERLNSGSALNKSPSRIPPFRALSLQAAASHPDSLVHTSLTRHPVTSRPAHCHRMCPHMD